MKDTDSLGCTIHWWQRDLKQRAHIRLGYLEVHDEGLLVRVEDDAYDGVLPKEEALDLAREIFKRYGA